MATVKQRLEALERNPRSEKNQRPSPEKLKFIAECMAGLHLEVFSLERIAAAKAMLESML